MSLPISFRMLEISSWQPRRYIVCVLMYPHVVSRPFGGLFGNVHPNVRY